MRSIAAVSVALLAIVGVVGLARFGDRPAAATATTVTASSAVARDTGYAERRLTAYAAENPVFALDVSRDGLSYAYANGDALHVASLDEHSRSAPQLLAVPPSGRGLPSELQFFPDNRRILVGDFPSQDGHTWILSLDGQPPQPARDAVYFALAPDGRRIAFRQQDDIVVGDVMGGKTTYIESTHDRGEVAIAWSPDGTRLAIARLVGTTTMVIEVARADGSSRKTLSTATGNLDVTTPTWTANDRIAFETPISDESIAIVERVLDANDNAVGPERRVWTRPFGALTQLEYRNGRYFYIRMESQRDVYAGRLDSSGRRLERSLARFTLSDNDDAFVGWMPDGRIVYESKRDGAPRVYVSTLEAARAPSPLTNGPLNPFGVTGDGEILSYQPGPTSESGTFALVGINGTVRELGSAPDIDVQRGRVRSCAGCSLKNPVRCVVGVRDGSETSFSLLEPVSGKLSPFAHLSAEVPEDCSLGADGSTLFMPDRTQGFRAIDIASGAVRTVKTRPPTKPSFVAALPGTSDVLLAVEDLSAEKFARFALVRATADGQIVSTLWTSETVWISHVAVAPNGRDVAVTARAFDTDVYMLEPADAK